MNIEEIKNKIDILEVVSRYVKLKRVGSYYSGLCPFHKETKPSFYVSPQRQIFKCFGCGEGGDVLKFLMKIENLSYKEVLEKLKEEYHLEIKEGEKRDSLQERKILEINYSAIKFFKEKIKENLSALEYLKKRGFTDKTIEFFEIGFSPGNTLLRDYLYFLGYSLEDLKRAGLLDSQNYDRFQSRIIFPLRDERGKLVGFMGRAFPETRPGPKYLNTPETILFKKSNFLFGLFYSKDYILNSKKALLVEGTIDFILCFQNGLKNTVAISGSALTLDHLRKLKKYTSEIVFAFDNDLSGFHSTLKANILAKNLGFITKKLIYPYKDLAEFFEKKESLDIIKEENFEDWLLSYLLENYQVKETILEIFLSQLKLLDPLKIDAYLNKLSQTLEINKKLLEEKISLLEKPEISDLNIFEEKIAFPQESLEERLSFRLVSLIYATQKDISEKLLDLLNQSFKNLLLKIKENKLEEEERDYLEMMKAYFENSKVNLEKEFLLTLRNLKKIILKNNLKKLQEELKTSENKKEVVERINQTLNELKKIEKNA